MASLCDSFCDGCIYMGKSGDFRCCYYLLATDKMRPCRPGKGCTVKCTQKPKPVDERTRSAKNWAREKQKRMRMVACEACGTVFQTSDSRKKFCNVKCFNESRKKSYRKYDQKRRGEMDVHS